MTRTIFTAAKHTQRITVTHVEAVKGSYHIRIESQDRGARDPEAWRTVYQVTCDEAGLEQIAREIYDALHKAKP